MGAGQFQHPDGLFPVVSEGVQPFSVCTHHVVELAKVKLKVPAALNLDLFLERREAQGSSFQSKKDPGTHWMAKRIEDFCPSGIGVFPGQGDRRIVERGH